MEKVLLSIVVASGLCAVSSHAGRVFHVFYEKKTWAEAQSYCREHYTDLATIDNMEDVDILKEITAKRSAWIGLHRTEVYSWMWSLTNSSFYKHGEMEFRNWSPGESKDNSGKPEEKDSKEKSDEPNDNSSGEYCGLMGDDGLWSDGSCSELYKAVCYYVGGSNVTYHLTSSSMSWTEGQSFCRENYTDLVSVRNNAENEKVKELVPPGTGVWIGLFRDSWKWTDGSNSSFRFWYGAQPDNYTGKEDCVLAHLGASGQWGDSICNDGKPFICYKLTKELAPKANVMTRQVFKLRLNIEDSENLDDEAMKEALLKEVKQKLKERGLEHVKVSFRKQADGKFFTKEEKETEKETTVCKNDEF